MDHPPPAPRFPRPLWLRPGLAAVIVAGYTAFLCQYISPYAGGADSSGYLNSARLLSRGEVSAPVRTIPGHPAREFGAATYQPLGFTLPASGDRMVPTYPIGLPLHLLVGAGIAGWSRAAIAVNLLMALGSGGLMWAFARQLHLGPMAAGAGAIVLCLCPVLLFSALQPMSDLLSLAWSLATLYCALRVRDNLLWACACGVAFSLAVLVRPTNLLLAIPTLVALAWHWRVFLAVTLGGLPGSTLLAFYNWKVYGTPVTTGYGDVRSAFSPDFLPHNLLHFAHWIPLLLTPLVVGALAAPFLPEARQRGFAVLAVWSATLIGFYSFYYHSGETWWYLRFILPAFPTLIIAALFAMESIGRNSGIPARIRPVAAAVLMILAAGWQIAQSRRLHVCQLKRDEQSYPDAAHWARANLPPEAVVFCMQVSGAFYYYTDFLLLRWEQTAPDQFAGLLAAAAQANRPVYAALFPFEQPEALERVGGHWTKLATVGQVTIWQRQP